MMYQRVRTLERRRCPREAFQKNTDQFQGLVFTAGIFIPNTQCFQKHLFQSYLCTSWQIFLMESPQHINSIVCLFVYIAISYSQTNLMNTILENRYKYKVNKLVFLCALGGEGNTRVTMFFNQHKIDGIMYRLSRRLL